jgi:hypothetical protein
MSPLSLETSTVVPHSSRRIWRVQVPSRISTPSIFGIVPRCRAWIDAEVATFPTASRRSQASVNPALRRAALRDGAAWVGAEPRAGLPRRWHVAASRPAAPPQKQEGPQKRLSNPCCKCVVMTSKQECVDTCSTHEVARFRAVKRRDRAPQVAGLEGYARRRAVRPPAPAYSTGPESPRGSRPTRANISPPRLATR